MSEFAHLFVWIAPVMSMIYQEMFEIGPETQQMSVGARVYHHPQLAMLADYEVLFMGLSEAKGLMHVERIGAPFHVLILGVEGQGEIIAGDEKTPIGPNQLAILPAYSHSGFRRVSEHWRCVWFLLNDAPCWNDLALEAVSVRSVQNAHSLFFAMYALCHEARLNQNSFSREALILVIDLLKRMLERAVVNEALADRLRAVFSGIRFAPAQAWRVEQLAEHYGVSTAHFHRLCLKNMGATPLQLIIEQRMLRARELLASGRYTVSEVATAVGYEEIASFSRRFRAHFGIAAGDIRKQINANIFRGIPTETNQ